MVHEVMNCVPNLKVHLRNCSGNIINTSGPLYNTIFGLQIKVCVSHPNRFILRVKYIGLYEPHPEKTCFCRSASDQCLCCSLPV